ncbi:MAG: DUF3368 domain-containing protein [Nitrososphaeria archaeon]|nr:DUF3368 domain-containing protein [Nitrososphaeria archaeon]
MKMDKSNLSVSSKGLEPHSIDADASILIHLSKIGRFHLLRDIYNEIIIASNVFTEVVEKGYGLPGSIETENGIRQGWIKVHNVLDKQEARKIATAHKIHSSNAETIQLAREIRASILLADEEEVRELATEFGLKVRRCLGLLVESVKQKLISVEDAKNDAKRLIEEGYRISEKVLKEFYNIKESEEARKNGSSNT